MKRPKSFHLALSQNELNRLHAVAEAEGVTCAAWLRAKIRERWRQGPQAGLFEDAALPTMQKEEGLRR